MGLFHRTQGDSADLFLLVYVDSDTSSESKPPDSSPKVELYTKQVSHSSVWALEDWLWMLLLTGGDSWLPTRQMSELVVVGGSLPHSYQLCSVWWEAITCLTSMVSYLKQMKGKRFPVFFIGVEFWDKPLGLLTKTFCLFFQIGSHVTKAGVLLLLLPPPTPCWKCIHHHAWQEK